jgi:DNA-binding MarR family transcriptional regulator
MPGSQDARLLKALLIGPAPTQRSLSRELGVALGLTNLLIKRLVAKGYVKVVRLRARHVKYFVTVKGRAALMQETRLSMHNTVSLYTETRDLIRQALDNVASRAEGSYDVAFYGLGDVAEIAYISLQSTPLRLVGAVDDVRRGQFFGLEIQNPSRLTETRGPIGAARVLVTTVRRADEIRSRLAALGVPPSRVSCFDFALAGTDRPEFSMTSMSDGLNVR